MVNNTIIVSLIPVLPLIGFLLIGLNVKRLSHRITSVIACGSVFLSFILSVIIFGSLLQNHEPVTATLYQWIKTDSMHIAFSFVADQLSSIILLIITGVGFLIHF